MSSEDFKSFCRALIPSGVGSIPTRSRQLAARALLPAVGALALGADATLAQPTDPDPVPESAEVVGPEEPEPFRPSPRGALIRSTLVPGWGQLYNHRWIKGLLFAAGRIYLGARAVEEHELGGRLEDEALAIEDEAERGRKWRERNRAFNRRDDFIWYSAYALLFTMAEAYVDASLMEFGDEFDEVEELGASSSPHVRLGMKVRF